VALFEDRSRAESFGSVAELYDRARPTYPPARIDDLLADGARDVLDVGCGTGIASVLFASRGCEVTGIEVDPRMAEIARRKGLEVEVSAFESWEDRGRRFDLVVSGQAWHWIEPRVGAARAADVLRTGGRFGAFWNFGDPPAELRERLVPIYDRLAPGLDNHSVLLDRDHGEGRLRETAAGLEAAGRFGPVEVRRFPWTRTYDALKWTDHLQTHSDHQSLAPAELDRLLEAVTGAVEAVGGSFDVVYEAILVTATWA
jgi:SAM-dependent methyltransferase